MTTTRHSRLPATSVDDLTVEEEREFEVFYRRHRPVLSMALHRMTDDTRYVDDAVQEGLLIARRRWRQIRTYDCPEAWVVKVTVRVLLRWQQDERRRQQRFVAVPDPPPADNGAGSAEDTEVSRAVAALPRSQREVVVLHYYADLSVRSVADALCRAEGTVKAQLFTARETLKAALGEEDRDAR